jgi:site-specific DNA recombinase
MATMGKRAGLYPRKSKDERTGWASASVGEQEQIGRADCAEHGWTVVDVYPDDGRSASRFGKQVRDEWSRLRVDIGTGRLDLLWLWETDRGSRELEDWAGFLNLCRRRGVLIYVHTHGRLYDPKVARDRRSLLEDGIDAEYESEKKSLNVRRSLAANAASGKPHGPTTYGYERVYEVDGSGRRRLVQQRRHPEHAAVVEEIFRRLARADPISQVVTGLNESGVPAPKGGQWRSASVRTIARNPAYIAERRHAGQVYAASWPTLVDQPTWAAVQSLLSDPARAKYRPGRNRWMLSRLAVCGVCGETLNGRPEYRGRPAAYGCGGGCVSVQAEWLDDFVTALVVGRLSQPDVYADLAARRADDSAVLAAREEAATLRARLDEFTDAAAAGTVSAAALAKIEARLLPQIEAADQRAEREGVPPALRELVDPAENVATRWAGLSVAARKSVIRILFDRIALLPANGRRTLDALPDRIKVEWRTS